MLHSTLVVAIAVLGSSLAAAQTAPPQLARSLAATCANCHGTNGASAGGTASLAGMPSAEIVASMAAFKTGSRNATIMHQLAKGYTDEQIALIAGWFAAQRPAR